MRMQRAADSTRLGVLAVLLLGTLGCDTDPIFGSSPNDPAVYFVLSREPLAVGALAVPADSSLFALVGSLGSASAIQYRAIDSIVMTRRSDAMRFDWQILPREGAATPIARSFDLLEGGNARLLWRGSGGLLGREDLTDGVDVDLVLGSAGRVIAGVASIPTTPTITVDQVGGVTTIRWARSTGAERYWIRADTELNARFVMDAIDTSYVLKRDALPALVPSPPYFVVVALDSSLAAFIGDTLRSRAGVLGAQGVFGAMARDLVEIPPP